MMDQGLGGDLSGIGEMVAEEESTFDDPITIRRFTSRPSDPGAFGTPQAPQFTAFPATATLVEFGVASKMFAAGVLAAGDIVLQMRDKLNEGTDNVGGSQLADRVIFRGSIAWFSALSLSLSAADSAATRRSISSISGGRTRRQTRRGDE